MRGRKALLVVSVQRDMVWENNQLKEAVVHSNAGGNCVIKYADKTLSFKTVKGRSYRVEYDVTKGLIRQ